MSNFDYLKQEIESSFLSKSVLHNSSTGDGRLESAESEVDIANHIKLLFADNSEVEVMEAPRPRHWYDILIKYKGETYPINIKITSGTSADNVSSKLGLFYTLTGLWPENVSVNLNNWEPYNKALTSNFKDSDADYYFIVYFKNEEVFLFTSLKRIQTLSPNGNNLPFQCNWSKNWDPTDRTADAQREYLMNTFIQSYIQKARGLDILLDWKNSK